MSSLSLTEINFDPALVFMSGQTFRWRRVDRSEEWIGVVSGNLLKATPNQLSVVASERGQKVSFQEYFTRYFSFEDNLKIIKDSLPRDKYLIDAISKAPFLRILRQDPWECLISFVCSINKNIPAISDCVERLTVKFGRPIANLDRKYHSFPEPRALALATKSELMACNVGFRWRYIQYIARMVNSGKLDLDSLDKKSYDAARKTLISELSGLTLGVGPKVADCVLLFSLHKCESFPLDVWMLRCIKKYYASNLGMDPFLNEKKSISRGNYEKIQPRLRKYFGPFAGYAQQYLYVKIRNDSTPNKVLV